MGERGPEQKGEHEVVIPQDQGGEQMRDFFETHRDFFVTYAGDPTIRVEKSPPGLNTFAIDLEKGVLYGDPRYFTERGYSESKAFFAFLHEFEHFRELRDLLQEEGGERTWREHQARLKKNRRVSLFDNVWDDVRMNRSVVGRAPSQTETRASLYRENLFPERDMTKLPKHLQFVYTLLREPMLPDEECVVASEVRQEIDRLRGIKSKAGVGLLDYASRPDISSSMRIRLQRQLLEPVYEKFFNEDVEEKQKEKEEQGEKGQGQRQEGSATEQGGESQEGGVPKQGDKPKQGAQPKELPKNPEDFFKGEYDEFFEKNPDAALPEKAVEEAVKKYAEAQKEKSGKDMLEAAYASEAGVSVYDMRAYQRFWEQIERIENPETGAAVVEELREIFRKIITERMKRVTRPKLPVEYGEILVRPAEAVAAILSGDLEPAVWETVEQKERPRELFGEFDVTVVVDRSGSMDGKDEAGAVKKVEQKKAAVLLLEALTEFSRDLEEVRKDLEYDLEVRTESWSFGGEAEVEILKPLGSELTERQRVAVYKTLDTAPGAETLDYLALEKLRDSVPEEDWEKIAAKKLRKIVIVLTDGASSDEKRLKKIVKELRGRGVVVVGVGITKSGEAAKKTYAPDGQVCERADRLAVTLAELMKEYLKDL